MSPPLPKVRSLGFQLMPATTGLGPTGEAARAGAGAAASVKAAKVARMGVHMLLPSTRQEIVIVSFYRGTNWYHIYEAKTCVKHPAGFTHEKPGDGRHKKL